MRLKFFTVPALDPGAAEEDLNRFLGSHRVSGVDRHLVTEANGVYWSVCVSYLAAPDSAQVKPGKIDYREVLSESEFKVFAKLRTLRKSLAEQEGVPAYALFTNEQLAAMVRQRVSTLRDMGEIQGIGEARLAKYGLAFLTVLVQSETPRPGSSVGSDQNRS